MQDIILRNIDLTGDKDAALSFIDGSQLYEHAFEPDRRIDANVAVEHFAILIERVAKTRGRVFMAAEKGRAIGWAVFVIEQNAVYVVERERTYGYIAELFVEENARGRGIGRALISACENEARRLNLPLIMIGVHAGNQRAGKIYGRAGFAPYGSQLRKYL